jgi:hypothetical protein
MQVKDSDFGLTPEKEQTNNVPEQWFVLCKYAKTRILMKNTYVATYPDPPMTA